MLLSSCEVGVMWFLVGFEWCCLTSGLACVRGVGFAGFCCLLRLWVIGGLLHYGFCGFSALGGFPGLFSSLWVGVA